MNVIPAAIPEVLILESKVFGDARDFFVESFNQKVFDETVGHHVDFVQDNYSRSSKGVLRGRHYQLQQPQGKLVRGVRGAVFDVAVDIRKSSPTFGQWVGVELRESNHRQFCGLAGFAHDYECCIAWDIRNLVCNGRLSNGRSSCRPKMHPVRC